jgi:hypothetical protein
MQESIPTKMSTNEIKPPEDTIPDLMGYNPRGFELLQLAKARQRQPDGTATKQAGQGTSTPNPEPILPPPVSTDNSQEPPLPAEQTPPTQQPAKSRTRTKPATKAVAAATAEKHTATAPSKPLGAEQPTAATAKEISNKIKDRIKEHDPYFVRFGHRNCCTTRINLTLPQETNTTLHEWKSLYNVAKNAMVSAAAAMAINHFEKLCGVQLSEKPIIQPPTIDKIECFAGALHEFRHRQLNQPMIFSVPFAYYEKLNTLIYLLHKSATQPPSRDFVVASYVVRLVEEFQRELTL